MAFGAGEQLRQMMIALRPDHDVDGRRTADDLPAFDSSFVPSSKRAVPRSMVVEIHGQKRDVEAYARRVNAADLRRRTEG